MASGPVSVRAGGQPTRAPIHTAPPRFRVLLLGLAGATLLSGLWAGLVRLGWPWPLWQPALLGAHGPLMIGGFLGTLISLERAVALGQRWGYAAPVLAAAGAFSLLLGAPSWVSALSITGASAVLLVMLVQIWRIHPALYTAVIGLGAGVWLAGNGLWFSGQPVTMAVPWWTAFLVLTIAGERLELSRLLQLPRNVVFLFGCTLAVLCGGLVLSLVEFTWGMRLVGLGQVSLAAWLLRYDIAGRRLKAGGQARYMAVCLLSGYGWLAIGGGLSMVYGGITAGPYYDAMLHAVLLGFVFAMIFAHVLIIFPAIAQVAIVYTPRFYSHLIVLQIGLTLRMVGDLLLWLPGRQWGGLLNALAILLLIANLAHARQRT
jgi:hypothetical protein